MRAGLRADRAIVDDAPCLQQRPRRPSPSPSRGGPGWGWCQGTHVTVGRRRGARQRGFSLLELLLVMALIAATGLLAAGVLTGGFDRMALRTGAKEMAAQMRFARAHAIATGVPQTFTVDPAARTWQGANGRGGELPGKLEVRFTGAREVQPRAGVGAIVFFGDGASTGGRLQLSLRDAAWNIDVAWLTGEVTLRRGEVVR
ncbi:MAG TPA: GspH/FimT family pseudopilin [Luteimonas sp.]|nr:GspH/FimT family pseudopilin [Luteimonas sp.]